MRKITLFLMSLFLTVGAMAQFEAGKLYRIKEKSTSLYLSVGGTAHEHYGEVYGAEDNENDNRQIFMFEQVDNGKYLVKSNSGEYITETGTGAGWNVNADPSRENAHELTFVSQENINEFKILCYNTEKRSDKYFKWEHVSGSGKYHPFNDNDNGAVFIVEKVVREGYVHNTGSMNRDPGQERGLTTFTLTDGTNSLVVSNIQDANSRTAAVYVDKSDQKLTTMAGATLKFTAFNYTGSWMHAYAYVDYNNDKIFTLENNNGGNSTGEIVSYNYYNGKDILNNVGNENGEAIISVYDGDSKAMPAFTLPADLKPGEYRMRIKIDWDNIDADYGASDIANNGGCQCDITIVVEGADPCTITYNYKEGDKLIASISHETYVGADYPALDTPACEGVEVVGQRPTVPVAGNEDVDIQVTTTGIPFEFANSYSEIKKWYYLKFDTEGSFYLRHNADQDRIALTNNEKKLDNENISNCMWAFVGNPFVGYKIVNHATGEGYILSSSTTMSGTEGGGTHPIMTDEENLQPGNNEYWIPTLSAHGTNGFYLAQKGFSNNRMNNRDNALAYWTEGAGTGSTFWVEECTSFNVTVSDLGFATLYLDYAAYIPSGVEVYIITKDDIYNGYVTLTPVTGVLPANTGVIVKASKGSYTFYKSTENVTITGNLLSGTVETGDITKENGKEYYILANKDGVGMYIATLGEDKTKFKNTANKAYLVLDKPAEGEASSASLRFDFGGTTGVEEVETEVAETVIYDLTGRRVNEIIKAGVYIINGKKVMVK